jgi:hypothetical protein
MRSASLQILIIARFSRTTEQIAVDDLQCDLLERDAIFFIEASIDTHTSRDNAFRVIIHVYRTDMLSRSRL